VLRLSPAGKVCRLKAAAPAIKIASIAALLRALATTCRFHPRGEKAKAAPRARMPAPVAPSTPVIIKRRRARIPHV